LHRFVLGKRLNAHLPLGSSCLPVAADQY